MSKWVSYPPTCYSADEHLMDWVACRRTEVKVIPEEYQKWIIKMWRGNRKRISWQNEKLSVVSLEQKNGKSLFTSHSLTSSTHQSHTLFVYPFHSTTTTASFCCLVIPLLINFPLPLLLLFFYWGHEGVGEVRGTGWEAEEEDDDRGGAVE